MRPAGEEGLALLRFFLSIGSRARMRVRFVMKFNNYKVFVESVSEAET
jgi:hypothetical protein